MKRSTTQTFEYSKEDIEALIKNDVMKFCPNTSKIQVVIQIESQPGYEGPGIPPQVLTKITASYNQ